MPLFSSTASFPTSIAGALLQQDYLPGIQSQLNNDTVLADQLGRVPEHMFVGNQVQMAALTSRGITHTVDAGAGDVLPPNSRTGHASLTFDVVEIAHRIGMSASALMRTRNSPDGAFVNYLADQMDGAREDMGQELNRQRFGDATGRLAYFTVTRDSTIQFVDSTKFLRESMPIVCADTANAPVDSNPNNTIVSIDSGTQITLAAAITTVASTGGDVGDYIFHRRGSVASGTTIITSDMWGLQNIVQTTNPYMFGATTFGGLSKATRVWQGNRLTASNDRPLHSRLMMHGLNYAQRRSGKKNFKGYMGLCTDAAWLEYGEDIVADKRYPAAYTTLDGAWAALDFAGVPIVWDKDCPTGKLFFIHKPDIMIAMAQEPQFEDRDGSVMFRGTASAHQFEVWLYTFQNLIAKKCNSSVAIENIKESNRTDNL